MTLLLGVDYGGTTSKLLLARTSTGPIPDPLAEPAAGGFTLVRSHRLATPRDLPELAGAVRDFLGPDHPATIGITVPGVLDEPSGIVLASTNLPWLTGIDPAREVTAALGIRTVAVNDGYAAASAEATLGAGRGSDDLFVLALGTGIAGAHIVAGELRRGAHGAAGEVGHIGSGKGRLCSCGQRGCLESAVGGAQLAARWSESRPAVTTPVSPAGTDARPLGPVPADTSTSGPPSECARAGDTRAAASASSGARAVVDAAAAGDRAAIALLDDVTTTLSHSLLGIVALLDPGLIVIGGGLAESRTWILDPVVDKTTRNATFHQLPPIVPAELGVWAGAWGAILAAGTAD